jgi:hypothetical protein
MEHKQRENMWTHILKAREKQNVSNMRHEQREKMSTHILKTRDKQNVSNMGHRQREKMQIHILKARQGKAECEQDGTQAKRKDANSHPEGKAGKNKMWATWTQVKRKKGQLTGCRQDRDKQNMSDMEHDKCNLTCWQQGMEKENVSIGVAT